MADRGYILDHGRIVRGDTAAALLSDRDIQQIDMGL